MKLSSIFPRVHLWGVLLALCFSIQISSAQHNLEEIRIHEQTDTRCLGINNAGFICGYYISPYNGKECGFVVTPKGQTQLIDSLFGANLGYGNFNHYRVVAVSNDTNNSILIRAAPTTDLSSSCTILKALYNKEKDLYDSFAVVPAPTANHPHSTPAGINYYGDMVGWYHGGGSGRFLWYANERQGTGPYAARVQINTTQYRTFTGGINDSGLVCGSYYDDNSNTSTWKPFSYNISTNNFVLFNTQNLELRGVNNHNIFVGVIGTGGNTRAYMVSANGTVLQNIPHSMFRPGVVMQSELNGINDNRDVVGSFRHPSTNKWVGFVYQPSKGNNRIPGFNFANDTWKMKNTSQSQTYPNAVWTSSYWGRFDYKNDDPYAQNGVPLLENTGTFSLNGGPPPDSYPSWVAFMEEVDVLDIGKDPAFEDYYKNVFKPFHYKKYTNFRTTSHQYYFKGVCYGFTYTTLQRHFLSADFSNWFGLPQNYDISQANNTDFLAVKALERTQLKQSDYFTKEKYGHLLSNEKVTIWQGMRYLKNTFSLPRNESNPKGVSYYLGNDIRAASHIVLPWKISTPQAFPFEYNGDRSFDSLFVYDSNHPEDSTRVIVIPASTPLGGNTARHYHDSAIYVGHSPIFGLNFNHPGVRPQPAGHREHSMLKRAPGKPDSLYSLSLQSDIHFILTAHTKRSELNNSGWKHDISVLHPIVLINDTSEKPAYFFTATTENFSLQTSFYKDSIMTWTQGDRYYQLMLQREARQGEIDYGHIAHRSFSYGTHDAVTKTLQGSFSELSEDNLEGVNIIVKNLTAKQGDSLITRSPSAYQYQIIRLGGTNSTYDLTVFAGNKDSLRETKVKIPINGTATHTIDPYFEGPNGTQTVIFVDNGNTGKMDDTLLLDGKPPVIGVSSFAEDAPDISVYPSPVHSELQITIRDINANYRVMLTDLAGKQAAISLPERLKTGTHIIPTTSLAPGVYILQIHNEHKVVFREKIVKQ